MSANEFNETDKRKPAEFRPLICKAQNGQEYCLTYSKGRGFFEPITNQSAEPLIGPVVAWRYND